MTGLRDEFLSEEDLDLRNLSDEELERVWAEWLERAQASNDLDQHTYSHGVFTLDPLGRSPDSSHGVPGPRPRP